jgi:ankyrin repeat protein
LNVLGELLKHDKVDVDFQDHSGLTALTRACVVGNLNVLGELLKHDNVDVNVHDNSGHTALTWACERNDYYVSILS